MVISLLLTLTTQQAPAGGFADLPQVEVRTYVADGRNPAEVRESVDENRPEASDGRGLDASTTWTYAVHWQSDATATCRPETAEVTASFVVTLPELAPTARLRGVSLSRWNDWAAYLAAHERRRVEVAIGGFEAMQASMRAAPDCAAMAARQAEALAAIAGQGRVMDAALAEQYRRNRRRLPTFP